MGVSKLSDVVLRGIVCCDIGLTEGTFKQRFTQHKHSFRHRSYMNIAQNYPNISGNYATATKTSMLSGLSSAEQDRTATSRRDATFARQKN